MAYRYHFTNYANFRDHSNAITPLPSNWPIKYNCDPTTPVSVTPPTVNTFGAIDYQYWSHLDPAHEFMVQSNINNWISCKSLGFSGFPNWVNAHFDCTVIKPFTSKCRHFQIGLATLSFSQGYGPKLSPLSTGKMYYYWECNRNSNWPTADPCGRNSDNHEQGVQNPYGALFFR